MLAPYSNVQAENCSLPDKYTPLGHLDSGELLAQSHAGRPKSHKASVFGIERRLDGTNKPRATANTPIQKKRA